MLQYDCRTGQGGVTAQGHFYRRGEPAQTKVLALWYQKGGFRQIVLSRNRLHQGIVRELGQQHHGSRVACKQGVSKGIDLIDG